MSGEKENEDQQTISETLSDLFHRIMYDDQIKILEAFLAAVPPARAYESREGPDWGNHKLIDAHAGHLRALLESMRAEREINRKFWAERGRSEVATSDYYAANTDLLADYRTVRHLVRENAKLAKLYKKRGPK